MKKRIPFFIPLALFSILLSSCKLTLENPELLKKPVVTNSTTKNSINISISKLSDETKYIHIYRLDTSDENAEPVTLGMIYPDAFEASENSYIFPDELLYKNHTYKYMVRYCDDDGYHYTDWSNEIKVAETQSVFSDTDPLGYITNSTVYFTYDDEFYTLTLNGELAAPSFEGFEDFYPMLILQTGELKQVFKLTSIADKTVIYLRGGMLPNALLDSPLEIQGVVAQKKIYDNDDPEIEENEKKTKYVIWSQPTKINVKNYSDPIVVPSVEGSAGIDYSRKAKY